MIITAVRDLFTEHENHLTEGLPDLVAVGYVNAHRRDGRGEKSATRLVVRGNQVYAVPNGSLDDFDLTGSIFRDLFRGN